MIASIRWQIAAAATIVPVLTLSALAGVASLTARRELDRLKLPDAASPALAAGLQAYFPR
ncbi:MAG: hypothetical protein ACKVVT_17595 [Dehalococcoidia bacterium]